MRNDGFVELVQADQALLQRDVEHERVRVREDHLADQSNANAERLQESRRFRPDGDQARFGEMLTLERLAAGTTRPRRRRWRELDRLDAEIAALQGKHGAAVQALGTAEVALERAPQEDAERYATWIRAGEQGDPPVSSIPQRELERDGRRAHAAGIDAEVHRAVERRIAHVERNRPKMLGDADREIEQAKRAYVEAAQALAQLRQAVLDARELHAWTSTFPAQVEPFGFEAQVCLGLAEPVRRATGSNAQIAYGSLIELLNADAETLATPAPQVKHTLGTSGPRSPTREAMWDADEDMIEWKRVEKERARMLAERDFRDPHALGDEIRE